MRAGAAATSGGSGSSTVSAINAITVATGALASAGNRMRRTTPEADASISMFALSVSTSKRISPFSTRSPSFLCHAISRPSSMVSPSFGRMTFVTLTLASSGDEPLRGADDVVDLGHHGLLEVLGVRDRRLEASEPPRWRVEVVERFLGDDRGDLAAVPATFDRLMHDQQPVCLADRGKDGVAVERYEATQVDDLGLDAVRRELVGGLEREQHLARPGHDREIGPCALHVGLAERDQVLARRHLTFRAVEELVLEEDDRVVVADRGCEETFRVGGRRRHHDLEARDMREPRLERLRVLRRVAAARPALRTHDHRHPSLPAEHEAVLRGLVDELVHRQAGEV